MGFIEIVEDLSEQREDEAREAEQREAAARIIQLERELKVMGFLAVALIPVFSLGIFSFLNAKSALEEARHAELETIADLKVDKIETFFHERAADIKTAQDYFNIKTNLPIMTRLADDRAYPDYIAAKAMLDAQLQNFQKVYGYADVMLVSPDGRIAYVTNEGHEAINLGKPLPEPGGRAFKEGQEGVSFSDVFINKLERDRFSLFVAAPAHGLDGQFIGVIALEIDMDSIYQFVQNTAGLGDTGETLVGTRAGDEILFLNPLRHNQEAALKRRVAIGSKLAIPIQEAALGRDGPGYKDGRIGAEQ